MMIDKTNGMKMMRRNAVSCSNTFCNEESEENNQHRGSNQKSASQELNQEDSHVINNDKKNKNSDRRRIRYSRRGGIVLNSSSISISSSSYDDNKNEQQEYHTKKSSLSDTHILIDQQFGFDVDHEGNDKFIAILDAYYTDMYAEADSKIHRGIILNTVIEDIYARGFKFVWRSSRGAYKVLNDDLVIMKQIKSLLKRRI